MGGLGGQVHEVGDGLAGLAFGAGLQELAQGDEGEDHARRLKVQVHVVLLHQLQVAVAQAVPHLVQGKDPVDHCRRGAYRNEGVHVGGAAEEGLKAYLIIFIVEVHDRQGEQQLGETKGHGVLRPQQEGGEGRSQHVAHGDVKEGDEKHQGPEKAVLHGGQLLLQSAAGRGRGLRAALSLGQGGAVTRLDHRLDDVLGGEGGLVVDHRHGVGHETDLGGGDALQFVDCLLHVGRAGGTGHARDRKFLFQGDHQTFCVTVPIPGDTPPRGGVPVLYP